MPDSGSVLADKIAEKQTPLSVRDPNQQRRLGGVAADLF
jgi:hypothetical protein